MACSAWIGVLVVLGAAITSVASIPLARAQQKALGLQQFVDGRQDLGRQLCSSNRWRHLRVVLSQGGRSSQPPRPAKSRNREHRRASSMAGSLRVNHCCLKWMRSMASTANGGRPRRPSGRRGAINEARSPQGPAHSISPRNSRLRVRWLGDPYPRLCGFMRIPCQQTRLLTSTGCPDLCRPGLIRFRKNCNQIHFKFDIGIEEHIHSNQCACGRICRVNDQASAFPDN